MAGKPCNVGRGWAVLVYGTPAISFSLIYLSLFLLRPITLPLGKMIQPGKPLLTVVPEVNSDGAVIKFHHAVRMPDGSYRVYWVEQPQVMVIR